ncbi:porin family protein [Pseudohalocynthiibacter aestuariivivens]|uniref:Outer membrane beta-barrel protein n=1 Tax=Roseovarius pelagicus TaxID=2980108 RepID=A0ABY6DBK1_9RHOB|nr:MULTISPECIES: outer membrane beta-barrel protein [Rhodobacterales]QIE44615.1 porin family protein [Pseudohalocynthiibacter aestuariivivens]UXX83483.1 outer membrane beta-barrel protein [Roseovarius pelagicus]
MFRRLAFACILLPFFAAGGALAQSTSQDWNGPYVGLHLGGAYAGFTNRVPTMPGPTQDAGTFLGGVQLGYNWQQGNTVFGAEVDYSLMELRGSSPGGSFEENSMGSLRFRAGQVLGETLFFGSLGVAWTEKKTSLTGLGSTTDYEPGLMIGGGAERWLGENLTGRIEAYYVDVPKSRQNVGGVTTSGGSQNGVFRAGLNLHF